ncbi:unnamed protein product [Acanthocheilonema viteae]|uniref:Uncharacterized protein n=1 Tax=Acanthocheilonema viteae TaxID=6277 RepID=A0A498S9N1_ACAVI|nr:unnamed protein product [Acanthocheilonema viteae]
MRLHVKDNSLNHERTEIANVEEQSTVEQETSINALTITKSVGMIHNEEMINKHLKDNLSDFIFNDNYFEDSWGLHSDLLFATYTHQISNTFISPVDMEKTYSSEESNMLDQTDYNMNGMFVYRLYLVDLNF